MPVPSSRFLREAALLAVLLVLWAGLRAFLSSRSAVLSFAERPPLAELLDRRLRVWDAGGGREVTAIGSVRTEPGHSYLLRVRATGGPEFRIVGLDHRGAPALRRTIPGRAAPEDELVLFGGGAAAENLRLRIVYNPPTHPSG